MSFVAFLTSHFTFTIRSLMSRACAIETESLCGKDFLPIFCCDDFLAVHALVRVVLAVHALVRVLLAVHACSHTNTMT